MTTEARPGVSLSHDDGVCLVVAGAGPQGCDLVEEVVHDRDTWRRMLGPDLHACWARLEPSFGPDRAGRHVWAARESAMKAFDTSTPRLAIDAVDGGDVLYIAQAGPDGGETIRVLSFETRLTRGRLRTVAMVLASPGGPAAAAPEAPPPAAYDQPLGTSHVALTVDRDAPTGGWQVALRQPVSMREASHPSGNLRCTTFFGWMGHLRELAAQPVLARWVEDFRSGDWGAVTNYSQFDVVGVATAGDVVEGSVWSTGTSGSLGSTINLAFRWVCVAADGARRPIATGRMATTWVRLLGHGEAAVAPNPPYLEAFAQAIAPPTPLANEPDPPRLSETFRAAAGRSHGRFGPDAPVLRTARFPTTLAHGNIVGNVYFANYGEWMGEVVDDLLHEAAGELLKTRRGELRWHHAEVVHLREAMPFDTIEVRLQVAERFDRGLHLRCTFWRGESRLAHGEVAGLWYIPRPDGSWEPHDLPPSLRPPSPASGIQE